MKKKLEHNVLQFIQGHAHRQALHTVASVYRKTAAAMDQDTFLLEEQRWSWGTENFLTMSKNGKREVVFKNTLVFVGRVRVCLTW